MNAKKLFLAAVLLAAGVAIGWGLGHPSPADPTPIAAAHIKAAPAGDQLSAPPGGFDPAFVKVGPVSVETVPETTRLSGKLAFDAEHLHLVSSRVAGRLDRILVFEGAKVGQGQVLAELYSPDWIAAQNELLLAKNTVRTFEGAGQKELLEDARATETAAKNRMRVLGASEDDIAKVLHSGTIATHLALRAPISGVVTKRNMDPGAFLNVGDNFMTVSDTSHLWFVGNIYESDYARVKLGQALQLQVPALANRVITGAVNFIGTNIDPATHTLPIRCILANPDGSLRPELFVSASLGTGTRQAVVVPKAAIVTIKQTAYVILETSAGHFRRQPVSVISLADGRLAVTSGLGGGERIVTEGGTLVNEAMSNG